MPLVSLLGGGLCQRRKSVEQTWLQVGYSTFNASRSSAARQTRGLCAVNVSINAVRIPEPLSLAPGGTPSCTCAQGLKQLPEGTHTSVKRSEKVWLLFWLWCQRQRTAAEMVVNAIATGDGSGGKGAARGVVQLCGQRKQLPIR